MPEILGKQIQELDLTPEVYEEDLIPVSQGGITNCTTLLALMATLLDQRYPRLNAVNVFGAAQVVSPFTLTDAEVLVPDCNLSNIFLVQIIDNREIAEPVDPIAGGIYTFVIQQDSEGGRTVSWDTIYNFGADGEPTLSIGADLKDILTFFYDGTSMLFTGIKKGF